MMRKKAVALRYEEGYKAPKVTAIGFGQIAENILNEAENRQIPIVENEALIESLSVLAIDQDIPPELYDACASIISFIYSLDSEKSTEHRRE